MLRDTAGAGLWPARDLAAVVDDLAHFQKRVIQDALIEATSNYWNGRANQLETAMPRAGDFTGNASPAELEDRRLRVAAAVLACRQRAAVSPIGSYDVTGTGS